jgi:hypothetical protein
MPKWYWIFLIVIFGAPLLLKWTLKWIVAPILLRSRQHMKLRPAMAPAGPDVLTPEFNELVAEILPQFRAEGFELAASLHQADGVPGVTSAVFLLVNRHSNDVAQVIATRGGRTRTLAFTVRSEFADESAVVTAHSRSIIPFPRDPKIVGQSFAWVRDARTLCELHRRRMAREGKADVPRVAPAPGDEVGYFDRERERTFARWERHGYVYRDAAAGLMRYTWKGAFLCAWKLSDPIKRWSINRRNRKALAEWNALGMAQWQVPSVTGDVGGLRTTGHGSQASRPNGAAGADGAASAAVPALGYETALAPNEIREESTPGGLVVRVGVPTFGRYLADRWLSLLSIGFWSVCVGLMLYFYWNLFWMSVRFPGAVRANVSIVAVVLPVFFLGADVYRLVAGLAVLRGTTVLTASGGGLTFRNVPAFAGSGHLRRDEIESLVFVLHRGGFRRRRRLYRLIAMRDAGRRQTLLIHPDVEALNVLRTRLARAMGIESGEASAVA